MKELYVAPEVRLISFVAVEELSTVDFDDLANGMGGNITNRISGDVRLQ